MARTAPGESNTYCRSMSPTPGQRTSAAPVRFEEIRRFQVYRLDRPRQRTLLQRLRRGLRARLHR